MAGIILADTIDSYLIGVVALVAEGDLEGQVMADKPTPPSRLGIPCPFAGDKHPLAKPSNAAFKFIRWSSQDHLHGHQAVSVLVITFASEAELSCACSSSSTIKSSSASVVPSGRQMPIVLGTLSLLRTPAR